MIGFPERVDAYIADEKKLLEKYGIKKRIVVTFPRHLRKPPLLGKLAVRLLRTTRAKIDAQFLDITK